MKHAVSQRSLTWKLWRNHFAWWFWNGKMWMRWLLFAIVDVKLVLALTMLTVTGLSRLNSECSLRTTPVLRWEISWKQIRSFVVKRPVQLSPTRQLRPRPSQVLLVATNRDAKGATHCRWAFDVPWKPAFASCPMVLVLLRDNIDRAAVACACVGG